MVRCKRCNRKLKNPKSIELGYGSSCAKKEGLITKRFKKKKDLIKSKDLFKF